MYSHGWRQWTQRSLDTDAALDVCEAFSILHGTGHANIPEAVDGLLGMRALPLSVALDRQGAETQHVFGLSFGGEVYADPLEHRHKLYGDEYP